MFFRVLDMPDVLKQRGQDTPEIACRYNMDTQDAYHQEGLLSKCPCFCCRFHPL